MRILLLFFCALSVAMGEDPVIEVRAQFVRATKEQVADALATGKVSGERVAMGPEQAEIVRAKLKEAGAEILNEPRVLVQSGQPAEVSAVREVRYPVEYEEAGGGTKRAVPTAFETRNVGYLFKVKPTAHGQKGISLAVEPEVTRFLGFVDYGNLKTVGGKAVLEDLLKAPLAEGGKWHAIFAAFREKADFEGADGQTFLMGGAVALEKSDGQPEFTQQTKEEEVYVLITATRVTRD